MKNLILFIAVCCLLTCVDGKAKDMPQINQKEILKELKANKVCINGVQYYYLHDYERSLSKRGYGYSYLAPVVDKTTLTFKTCNE